jgi:hypothetical protein
MTIDSTPTKCPCCKGVPRYQRGNPCEKCGSRAGTERAGYQGSRMDDLAFDEWSEVTKERDGEIADAEAERHSPWESAY